MTGEPLSIWTTLIARETALKPTSLLLDVGGGSGEMAAALHAASGARCVVVEPQDGPCADGATRVLGSAEALPFGEGVADAVLFSHVLHHTDQPRRALSEAVRVLVPGGHLAIRTASHADLHALPFAHWIPRLLQCIVDATPDVRILVRWIQEHGLRTICLRGVSTEQTVPLEEYAERAAMQAWREWAIAADGTPDPREDVRAWVMREFDRTPPVQETLIVARKIAAV